MRTAVGLFDFLKGSKESVQQPSEPVDRINLHRPEYQHGCDRVGDGLLHLNWARQAAHSGDTNRARMEYMKAVESWKQASETEGGKWATELELANKEYAAFVQTDPAYRDGIAALIPVINATPGILQTDIYKVFPGIEKEVISYILYFAASAGIIERTKKGRTYELRAN
jgi:hypothetical protein